MATPIPSLSSLHAAPQPDSPAPPSPAPPGVPSPDQKPEIGPMGEPPGVPSPTPAPQRHDELPHTIDPLGFVRSGGPRMPVPMRLRAVARPIVDVRRVR